MTLVGLWSGGQKAVICACELGGAISQAQLRGMHRIVSVAQETCRLGYSMVCVRPAGRVPTAVRARPDLEKRYACTEPGDGPPRALWLQ